MSRRPYTTGEAAQAVGVTRATLQVWIKARKIAAPPTRLRDGVGVRLWTARDVESLRKYKQQNYRKGRGRKPKRKK